MQADFQKNKNVDSIIIAADLLNRSNNDFHLDILVVVIKADT